MQNGRAKLYVLTRMLRHSPDDNTIVEHSVKVFGTKVERPPEVQATASYGVEEVAEQILEKRTSSKTGFRVKEVSQMYQEAIN